MNWIVTRTPIHLFYKYFLYQCSSCHCPIPRLVLKRIHFWTWLDAKLERITLVASWQSKTKKCCPLGSFSSTCSVLLYLFSLILPHTYYIRIVFNSADVWQNALGKSTTDSCAVCLRIYFSALEKKCNAIFSSFICFSNRLFFNSFTTKYILVH